MYDVHCCVPLFTVAVAPVSCAAGVRVSESGRVEALESECARLASELDQHREALRIKARECAVHK